MMLGWFSIDRIMVPICEIEKGDEYCCYVQCLPPGDFIVNVPFKSDGMSMRFGPSVTFRDARGVNWFGLNS